jgi:hypothetical protein
MDLSQQAFNLIWLTSIGSHLFEDVFVNACFCNKITSERGVVAFDDSSNPYVAKAIRFLRTNRRGVLEELDLSRYRENRGDVTRRAARYFGRVHLTAFRRVGSVDRESDAVFRSF